LNHSIVVQAACQAVVCGMMCLEAACLHRCTSSLPSSCLRYVLGSRLQAACLRNTPHGAMYSTYSITLDFLGISSTSTLAYELKILQVTQNRSRSFEITPMSRIRESSY